MKPTRLHLGGGAIFEALNPLDDSHYAHAAKGSGDDVHKAVAAAKSATKKPPRPSASVGCCA